MVKIAIVGITGLVGQKLLKLLESRRYPVSKFYPNASVNSLEQKVILNSKKYSVLPIDTLLSYDMDLVFFVSTTEISKEWIPKLLEKPNIYIIDNSSHYRMCPYIPLVIPEINGHLNHKKNKTYFQPELFNSPIINDTLSIT